ncbi:MAG: hypothetical protein ACRDPW_03565 [Mycobacteriales bacterium]
MPTPGGPASRPHSIGNWIVHRYQVRGPEVAPLKIALPDASFAVEPTGEHVSSAAGMWRLEQARREPPHVTSDITAVLEDVIGPLRRLDDEEGGSAAALGMVNHHIQTITAYLTRGRTNSPAVRQRLIRANAQLNQLAGWMAFDAERHVTAERYFRVGLVAARDIDDHDLTAYSLACMACHAAYGGQLPEAIGIADAAVRAARESHPAVRSITASRSGYAHAAAGDRKGFLAAADQTQQLWDTADREPKPDFLYWYGQDYIDIQRSESMQLLAFALPDGNVDMLREADELLDSRIARHAASMPRDVALHSAWLARTHLRRGEIDRALSLTEHAVSLRSVRSPRVRKVLRAVKRDLAQSRSARRLPRVRQLCQRIGELVT